MKKIAIVAVLLAGILTGCAEKKTIDGVTYLPYGLVNQEDIKNPGIAYELPIENVVAGLLLSETFVIPIYIVGWDLYQPVGVKPPIKGQSPNDNGK